MLRLRLGNALGSELHIKVFRTSEPEDGWQ
jgi:hypothetical protein